MTDRARLRELAEKATPGPWRGTTIGTATQRDAAGQAYDAVMAAYVPDNPEIQFTDMSWVRTEGDDWLNIAIVGNGPTSPENAAYIAAASPDVILALLADLAAAEERVRHERVTRQRLEDAATAFLDEHDCDDECDLRNDLAAALAATEDRSKENPAGETAGEVRKAYHDAS